MNRLKSSRSAKNPQLTFTSDTELKQRKATEKIREMSARWCYPFYEQLEPMRLNQRAE